MPTLQLNRLSLGVASTAPQIEGGRVDHSWMDWADRGHIRDGSSPARVNDHYRRFSEDAALMESQGMRDYRFGVGWARIEPEPGQFDDSALVHYREKLLDLQARGIRPQLTLHHFTNPMWFERMGAFTRLKNVPHFLRFVEHTVRALCDRISEYITTNEPNVYATNGYFFGAWPPGEASFSRTLYVMSVLCAAHIAGYACIHRVRRELGFGDTRVAFANHLRVFVPKNPRHRLHRAAAALSERFFQGSLSLAVTAGRFRFPLRNLSAAKPGRYCDFHAVNYYTRSTVSGLADGVRENAPVNDPGWGIYPPGIAECAKKDVPAAAAADLHHGKRHLRPRRPLPLPLSVRPLAGALQLRPARKAPLSPVLLRRL